MFRFIIILSLVCYLSINTASAVLTECPSTSSETLSIRLSMTLSADNLPSYTGTLLLSSNGNFVFLISMPNVNGPESSIGGVWSCSSHKLSLTANTFYFPNFSKLEVTYFTCEYTCGETDTTPRSCSATYKNLVNGQTGTLPLTLDLTLQE